MTDQDPYAYNAQWRLRGNPCQKFRIIAVVEDPDGVVPDGAPGGGYVVITGDTTVPLYTPSISTFLALFEREDGTRPQPVLTIPRQRKGD